VLPVSVPGTAPGGHPGAETGVLYANFGKCAGIRFLSGTAQSSAAETRFLGSMNMNCDTDPGD
jgi:hypothetical protein